MKEFRGVALNPGFVEIDGELTGFGEIILILSEPSYTIDAAGDMVRQRGIEDVRFAAGPKAIRQMAKHLVEYADHLEKLASKYRRVDEDSLSSGERADG